MTEDDERSRVLYRRLSLDVAMGPAADEAATCLAYVLDLERRANALELRERRLRELIQHGLQKLAEPLGAKAVLSNILRHLRYTVRAHEELQTVAARRAGQIEALEKALTSTNLEFARYRADHGGDQ
jgi:hypothetical protein